MLHGILHERLDHERGQANVPEPHRHVYRHPQPLFEPCPLDIEVRLDDLELPPERRELSFRAEDTTQQRREPASMERGIAERVARATAARTMLNAP